MRKCHKIVNIMFIAVTNQITCITATGQLMSNAPLFNNGYQSLSVGIVK